MPAISSVQITDWQVQTVCRVPIAGKVAKITQKLNLLRVLEAPTGSYVSTAVGAICVVFLATEHYLKYWL